MTRNILTLGVLVGLVAVGCTPAAAQTTDARAPRPNEAAPDKPVRARRGMVIRAYDIPAGSASRYRSMTRSLLSAPKGSRPLGRVAIAPDGRLVVVAPASVHEDLGPLFEPAGQIATAPRAISLTYWVVGAKRAPSPETAPELATIRESLAELSKRDGGLSFRLVDMIAVQSSAESHASHRGQRTEVEQSLHARSGQLVADLKIRTQAATVGPLQTSIAIVPDQAVVIGETGVSNETDERLIYLVRATLL